MSLRETAAFLDDDEAEDALGQSVELTNLKPPPSESKPSARKRVAATVARLPTCGGCRQNMDVEEAVCPGCDCSMHQSCGAPVGDEEYSPFRLCATCESSHLPTKRNQNSLFGSKASSSKKKKKGTARKRAPKADATLVKELMNKPPLRAKDSMEPDSSDTEKNLGFQASNHSIWLVAFFVVCLGVILVVKAATEPKPTQSAPRPQNTANPIELKRNFQDAWWLEAKSNDYLHRIYIDDETKNSMKNFRDVGEIEGVVFSDLCGKHRFDLEKFPKVSIVVGPVYKGFPRDLLPVTINSLFARTPTDMIAEILILVGDIRQGGGEDRELNWELQQAQHLSDLVKIKTDGSGIFTGPIAARVDAFERDITGDIVVFMDPYVEVWSSTWLQHLVLPIMENSRTVAVPSVHQLTTSRTLKDKSTTDAYYATMTNRFQIQRLKSRFAEETPSSWEPYSTPFFDGAVFAVQRKEFDKLGAVDEGLERFGGGNIALALKYWMCRGRVVMVPCSRVGHIPLSSFDIPPVSESYARNMGLRRQGDFMYYGAKANDETIISVRNYLRVMQVWAKGQAVQQLFYKAAFGSTTLPKEWQYFLDEADDDDNDFDREEAARDNNQCQDFEWFERHVLMSILGIHHPWSGRDNRPQ